jgi:mannose-6-phosphate isomerase-like protein (cupin superfamily)
MKNVESFIKSGILETYVLGLASEEEVKEVEQMSAMYEEVRAEIDTICETLQAYTEADAAEPNSTIKPMILASIDYEERIKNGEEPTYPPVLNEKSSIGDYSEWLNRKDMVAPTDFSDIYVKLIGYTPQAISGIVWIKSETPYETHKDQHEKFLIVEGTCDITIDGTIHSLVPGDYVSIPLYAGHTVKVTSHAPCKVILQRVAA